MKKYLFFISKENLLTFGSICDRIYRAVTNGTNFWRVIEAVITRRSWKPFGCKPTGVRIPLPPPTKNALLSTDKGAFFEWCLPSANDVGFAQWWRLRLMMCAWRHIEANIASLRNEVEQHHFERSEKHHIAVGDASFDKQFCDIIRAEKRWYYGTIRASVWLCYKLV